MGLKTAKITARIRENLDTALDHYCKANDVPRSYVIEKALKQYLEHPETHGPMRAMRDDTTTRIRTDFDGNTERWLHPAYLQRWQNLQLLAEGSEESLRLAIEAALVCASGECWPYEEK